ncbi:MAG: substrate-binding domain-containing protein, partial [Lachnospiraceae bacterium]|nr:substrate-binding domain-containing protein [Lachnospiraceae bacterium]
AAEAKEKKTDKGIHVTSKYLSDKRILKKEISVIGFDNVFLSELTDPPLTTIGQPIRAMGQAAAEILISMLEGRECERTVVFEGNLIVRGTT